MPQTLFDLDVLIQALADALETTAFVSLSPIDGDASAPELPRMASIAFRAPQIGHIELVAGRAFGALLVANVFATESIETIADQQADDALRELLNITCGDFVTRVAIGEGGDMDVSLPEIRPFNSDSAWPDFVATAAVFDADGNTIAVRIRPA